MNPEKGFKVEKLQPVNPADPRGATLQWQFPPGWEMAQITNYYRHAGQQFGQHVHHGTDPSKNPELLFLAKGRMAVTLVGLDGVTEEVTLEEHDTLTIWPGVKHSMKALTDVLIIEPRRTHFDPESPDTVPC